MSLCSRAKNIFSLLNNLNFFDLSYKCNLSSIIIRKTETRTLYTMSEINRGSNDVLVLTQRLEKAEKRLKLLTSEISDIKRQLSSISQNCPSVASASITTSARLLSEPDSSTNASNSKRTRYDFAKDGEHVVVYTDGACENNGRANAKAGIGVWFGDNHPLNVSQPVKGRPTNNTAEIQACIRAITIAHENGVTKLKIKTDSQFVINAMTQWIHRWMKNNWKLASGGDVKNKEDFAILHNACKRLENIIWEHVDGHRGILGNEQADKLARNGALRYTS